jgi:UDP:flavonoid glycosyltransferase YjiC (YdhE family)
LLPLPEPGIPPYGLGLAPAGGPLGALRDRVLWRLVEKAYGRDILPTINRLRSELGLATLDSPIQHVLRPSRLIVLTGAPLEYPRHALPASVRLVGIEPWDPPADAAPSWLTQDGDPWVLVTCSTHYQGDEALAAAAIEALRDEPYRVLVTLADAHGADLPSAANARVERFVSHGQVLPHAAAVVCPSGMGIVAKSLAARVPIVAVPFGRDQPEVARRVVEAGVGVRLPRRRLTPERLREAVRAAVALRPQVERGATAMDVCAAAGRFADAAEELLPGGSAPITSEPVLSASA